MRCTLVKPVAYLSASDEKRDKKLPVEILIMTKKHDEKDWVEAAQDLMEAGEWQEALDLLQEAPEEDGVRWLLSSEVWITMHQPQHATEDLETARALLGDDDPDVLGTQGRLQILLWQFDQAQATLEQLDVSEWGAQLLLDQALVADAQGAHDRAHQLLEEAHRIEPDTCPPPLRLEAEEFEKIVAQAAEELPEEFREVFDQVPVVIDPMPTAEVLDAPQSGNAPDILGLYTGLPLAEHESGPGGDLPPTIFLFQRNLERIATDRDHLCEEIRITLYHELAHALGFEEDGVEDIGLA